MGMGADVKGLNCKSIEKDIYPARACASKGLCDRSWCPYIYCLDFFFGTNLLSFKFVFSQENKLNMSYELRSPNKEPIYCQCWTGYVYRF